MDRFNILAVIISLALVGLRKLIVDQRNIKQRQEFAMEFLNQMREYVDSRGKNYEAYTWLIHRSNRMQLQMGSAGICAYRPPFQNYQIRNYPIIINMLPELRREFESRLVSDSPLVGHYVNALQEAIVRYIGTLDDLEEQHSKEIRNPAIWLRGGIRTAIALPITILSWFGLISEGTLRAITRNLLFRALAAIVGVIGFVSAIISIVLGWKPFVALLAKHFMWL